MSNSFEKDPDGVLDYHNDWSTWLGSDTIISSIWFSDEGITIDSSTFTSTGSTVWLSGGDVARLYIVTNRVVTAGGRHDDRSINITVKEK